MGQNETWPLFDGSYTNSAALDFGIDGLPAGDLNWFPAKKELWTKNKQAIDKHILSLDTDKMDLSTIADQDIIWDFDKDAQRWHDLGDGRDVKASWENGNLKMTYIDGTTQGPQLWFAAVQVDYDQFDASKHRYLKLTYTPVNWPTTSPVKVLLTFMNSNNEPVYSYATLDPTKTSVVIDIAANDPGWGKKYTGMMKSVQIELPHNGDPAANPAENWFGSSTLLDEVVLTNIITSVPKNRTDESVSLYPNPAKKSFQIIGAQAEKISIYNSSGVLMRQMVKNTQKISIEDFAKGMYIVKIESRGKTIVKKLLVE
jgi:hypothetical protein